MQGGVTNLTLISGPVGVGKTCVGQELSGLLEKESIAHTFVDLDGLSYTYPRSPQDPYGQTIAVQNLTSIWMNALSLGTRNLIVARVIESRAGIEQIAKAVGAGRISVIELMANDTTLIDRVRRREIGEARDWHEARSLELSAALKNARLGDLVIDTSRASISEIARQIKTALSW